jgi:histidinol phosphate phosphatase hisN-like protein
VSRRPRRNRPPRLDVDPVATFTDDSPETAGAGEARAKVPTLRRRVLEARIAGPHSRFGRDAVKASIRALVSGDRRARLGCDGLDGCSPEEVRDALVSTHGWNPDAPRAAIDPECTLAGIEAAGIRIAEAAQAGARVAVATARPASLLGLAQFVAGEATALGGRVLVSDRAAIDGAAGRELWWIGGVAVLTDGSALLASDGAGDDWLFAVGRPDLVIADRAYAGTALRAGCEVVAWADLDAPALSLAAARGRRILVVPLDERRPAAAYEVVEDALDLG